MASDREKLVLGGLAVLALAGGGGSDGSNGGNGGDDPPDRTWDGVREWYGGDMGLWEQTIYTTPSLESRSGRAPERSAVNYISGALKGIGVSHRIRYDFPTQDVGTENTRCEPGAAHRKWRQRVLDSIPPVVVKDSNLLLVNDNGGGCGAVGGHTAVAAAPYVPRAVEYVPGPMDTTGPHPGAHAEMRTVLHEVGHNMGLSHTDHGGKAYNDHDREEWVITPSVPYFSHRTNRCGETPPEREYQARGLLNAYTSCVREVIHIA